MERVADLAEKRGVSRTQVALAWLLQKQPVTAPIIGATKISHLEEAVGALPVKLTPEEVTYLEESYVPHAIVGHQYIGKRVFMDRVERSKQKYAELYGEGQPAPYTTDPDYQETFPDFQEILSRFIFGEVFYQGNLTIHQRELITLVVLTTNQTLTQLRAHVGAAMNVGLTPEDIKEAIYQCAPYIGFPKTLNALAQSNNVFKERNVALPLENQTQTSEDDRFEKGLQVQTAIFGEVIQQMRQNAPENQKHIQDYLSAFCFGDIYTRSGLDLQTRELLTLCILSALGGCESQVKSHVQGNLNVGNSKELMIEAITQCLPYMGFPRTLNALNCINEKC